ncbi:hypothetical protein EDB84DRAFT_1530162, partial [Lactarius hengduanensis]
MRHKFSVVDVWHCLLLRVFSQASQVNKCQVSPAAVVLVHYTPRSRPPQPVLNAWQRSKLAMTASTTASMAKSSKKILQFPLLTTIQY